jgi:acetyl-CoA carboxylase beta subunit
MGFSLTDLGNVAVGAIERDREITKEDLVIRAENLQANQKILIDQKSKKYEKELEAYTEEKKKFDAVETANYNYDGLKSIDARTYASQVLPLTTIGWDKLTDKGKDRLIEGFDGETQTYKLIGSEEEINKKAAKVQILINDETSEAIKKAKGNSFLINQILGKKERAEIDLYKEMESTLKAAETVKMTEQEVDQQYVGKEVKVGGDGFNSFINSKNSDKYQDNWIKQRNLIKFNIDKKNNNTFKFLQTTAQLGLNDELSYKWNKTDSTIEGMNPNAIANLTAMENMFNEIRNGNDTMVNHYYNVTKLHGNIGKTWNNDSIYKQMKLILDGRGSNITEGFPEFSINPAKLAGWGDEVRLTTFIPLSLVNQNNQMTFKDGSTVTFDKKKMKELSTVMNSFIADKALAKSTVNKDKDLQSLSETVYENLYLGNSNTMNEFLNYASSEDVIKKYPTLFSIDEKVESKTNTTDKTIVDNKVVETKPKMKFTIVTENGKDGIASNGVFKSWEQLEKDNKINLLGDVEKIEYDKWKSTQNKKIETNNPSYKQKTKEDRITPAIKNTITSVVGEIDKFGNNIKETEGEFGTGS